MEHRLIKILVALGIPGVALGVFYLLMRGFNFKFSEVPPVWSGVIAIMFIAAVALVTLFALRHWAPREKLEKHGNDQKSVENTDYRDPFVSHFGEVAVTFDVKMRSLQMDVVKVNSHDHMPGVAAEHAWINHHYPNSTDKLQALTTLEALTKNEEYNSGCLHFDKISITLPSGRKKDIYFDISSFYSGDLSLGASPDEFAANKLADLYAVDRS